MIPWFLKELPELWGRILVAMGIASAPVAAPTPQSIDPVETVIADNVTIRSTGPQVFMRDPSGRPPYSEFTISGGASRFYLGNGFTLESDPNIQLKITPTYFRIGDPNVEPAAHLHVPAPARSEAEQIARFTSTTTERLDINNATSTNGLFIARIQGKTSGQFPGLYLDAVISNDTGVGPAIVYNATLGSAPLVNRPLVIYRNNNAAKLTISANGNMTATAFNAVSSRTRKREIANLDSSAALEALRRLTPVEFVYNDDATQEKRLGFIAEDVPDLVADPERMSVPALDVFAVVTRVVKNQQATILSQRESLSQQEKLLNDYGMTMESIRTKAQSQRTQLQQQQQARLQRQKSIDALARRLVELERQGQSP